ncbi:hypothetical protein FACS1894147_01000 [Spirochaetia bacterium]|nr:hypothetical protein FACS1894147_01000 [Spirochaetia bacterium]
MKTVNQYSQKILNQLWELAASNDHHYKLDKAPNIYMPLTIEIIEKNQLSLCHYGEQNGDLMRDPEMVFYKNQTAEFSPIYFRNDYLGVEEFSVRIDGGSFACDEALQKEHTEFADMWIKNIGIQQELE